MKYTNLTHKILLLTVMLLILLGGSAVAGTAAVEQHYLSHNSLMDSAIAELTIDHSQLFAKSLAAENRSHELYAMAGDSGKSHSRAGAQRESGTALEPWHKYLGYGTLLMAGVTAVSHSSEDFHESAAYVTAAGALSTLLTGFLAHGDRFDAEQGLLSKDNLHIALGTLGAVVLTTAVAIADDGEESSHSSLGVSGGVLMALGVIDIKW